VKTYAQCAVANSSQSKLDQNLRAFTADQNILKWLTGVTKEELIWSIWTTCGQTQWL